MDDDSGENFNLGVMQHMNSKQKLELIWDGKEKHPCLESRILVEVPEKSYHAKEKGDNDIFDNMLIHGDNLLALKALEQDFAGKVKCIYIDPPYNTGNAFDYYDDGLEHSIWLNLMRERLEILKHLLSEDGSIWISIDEKEGHYLKVLCDEIFGRHNFVIQTTIQRGGVTGHKAINPTPVQVCDYMLTYAKNKEQWVYHPVYAPRGYDKAYNKYIVNWDEPYQKWEIAPIKKLLSERKCSIDELLQTDGHRIIRTAQPDYNAVGKEIKYLIDKSEENPSDIFYLHRENNPDIYMKDGERILFYKDKLRKIDGEWITVELVTNLWTDMNYQGIAKEGGVTFRKNKKPEAQIARILEMATMPGDLVLDSFLGSGTTCAVAHKMGRRWIGIELGEHCNTLCIPRLSRVINGEDSTGVSKKYEWHGGGGFRFYELGESLIKLDQWGQPIIDKSFNAGMLAQAVCKLEGFEYAPSQDEYFIHGHSTEHDFIYVTTNFMRQDHLDSISQSVGTDRTLLICCKGFEEGCKFGNLTMKKIPKEVLDKCEWGKDDYSLNVAKLPKSATVPVQAELF